jgi:hypothetical protein
MEARIVSFPTSQPAVRVSGDRIDIDRLALHDGPLAGWLAAQPPDDHSILVERALRIGLTALQSVGVTLNVDAVRAEFERFADQSRAANDKAAQALEQTLRANFGDGDGKLPRTLETFLGDRGKLKATVEELFDPKRQDSAVGRIATMLGTYFDGDASRLAVLLDPMRNGSPLSSFRAEVNVAEVSTALTNIRECLDAIRALKVQLTAIGTTSSAVSAGLDKMREAVLAWLGRAERELAGTAS